MRQHRHTPLVTIFAAATLASCTRMASVPFVQVEDAATLPAHVTQLEPSHQANAFLAAGSDGSLALIASATSAVARTHVDGRVLHAGFLADGRVALLLMGAPGQALSLELWRADLGERLGREALPPAPRPDALRYEHLRVSGSGRYVAVDHAVYDRQEARWLQGGTQHGHQTALEVVAERAVVSGGYWDERVLVRTLPSGAQEAFPFGEHVTAASYDATLERVFAGTAAGVVSVHVVSKDTRWFRRTGKVAALHVLAGAGALGVLAEGKLWLLSAGTLTERTSFDLNAEDARMVADDTWLAVADAKGRVHVVDVADERVLASDVLASGPIEALAVSRRMRRVLASVRKGEGSMLLAASIAR
jgi:hypothetical protein